MSNTTVANIYVREGYTVVQATGNTSLHEQDREKIWDEVKKYVKEYHNIQLKGEMKFEYKQINPIPGKPSVVVWKYPKHEEKWIQP